jgi:hypothetical protein
MTDILRNSPVSINVFISQLQWLEKVKENRGIGILKSSVGVFIWAIIQAF